MGTQRRKYRQDPKTGKMNGSVPTVVNPPEVDNPWASAPPASTVEDESGVTYSALFDAFSTENRLPAQFDPSGFPETFLSSSHPLAREVNAGFTGLDQEQRLYAVSDQLSLIESRLRKTPGIILNAPAESDEWAWWCHQQADRVAEDDPRLSAEYLELAEQAPPTNYEFAYLMSGRFHARAVAKSYDREMRYLAGYHGRNPDDIRIMVETERLKFSRMPDGEKPTVPEWFMSGIESSYWGKDRYRRVPMDKATMWGLYSVLSNTDSVRELPPAESSEYVVFDTETTGLSNKAAIVQITAIRYNRDGEEQERISTYLRPEDPSVFESEEAKKAGEITGITYATVQDSPTFKEVAPELRSMMRGRTLVAHNLMFDYPRVQRAFAESEDDDTPVEQRTLPMGPIVDTLRLARWVQPNPGVPRKDWKHTLEKACERAGIGFDSNEAHDALYDVERTNELFKFLRSAPLGGGQK